ncbi:hypothetical protein BMH32_11850 [Leucobacter sp. OLJS4]|uniref:hypothetical protein n=1 Tax=unclassified Leucobacter TaxID=2621730 RepID=UPI000C19C960|nr:MULTISPECIES: hypothetical protein [unclassified Leucobacter]PIJ55817.1 hypothetical protein BMH30_00265 [Leucobacter sp. OLES1]PII82296.1 hypothetical protein BMH25_10420 [Leucobacter sp. OLCALW19]PII88582.1 hypothetical protein BMH26_05930 [Leucobacter sp. OLTLW20]PII94112.1 hypothetical protein BMH27_01540 [Leucobacter sp. OLAS13]PII98315.1 hypothetical protein BMH29_09160 [Leucobacter sp. OLDS2]
MSIRDLPQYECTLIFRVRLKDEEALSRDVVDLVTHGSGDEVFREEACRLITPDPATAMMHILMRRHEFGPMGGTTRIGRTIVTVTELSSDGTAAVEARSTVDLRWDRE